MIYKWADEPAIMPATDARKRIANHRIISYFRPVVQLKLIAIMSEEHLHEGQHGTKETVELVEGAAAAIEHVFEKISDGTDISELAQTAFALYMMPAIQAAADNIKQVRNEAGDYSLNEAEYVIGKTNASIFRVLRAVKGDGPIVIEVEPEA